MRKLLLIPKLLIHFLFPKSDPRFQLLNKLPKNSVGLELGSWKGAFTRKIIKKVKPTKLYVIDPYKFYGEYKTAWFGGKIGGQEGMDKIYNEFNIRFRQEIEDEKLLLLRDESDTAFEKINERSLDWSYIDGNHTYEFVLRDLENSWHKVKCGGIICGDDYGLEGWWDNGVTLAVNDFINKRKESIEDVWFSGTQFFFRKKLDGKEE